jgi:hypothetical protein
MATGSERSFLVGYNLAWRLIFFVFALSMLAASIVLLVQSLLGGGEGLVIPSSMLVLAILLSLYLMPLINVRQQRLEVTDDGLKLAGYQSDVVLPWETVTGVRFKRVMLLMRYLVISTTAKEQLAQFLDDNPRSFLAKWTSHVGVLRSYPFILRWLFSVPKQMNTVAMLDWLERRYGGSIVLDVAAVNGRGRELERAIGAHISKRATLNR